MKPQQMTLDNASKSEREKNTLNTFLFIISKIKLKKRRIQ